MIKTPLYPDNQTVIYLLKIVESIKVVDFKNMWNAIWELRGTPQNTVDWKNPDIWIDQRLHGRDKEIALKIWNESNKTVNPRYTRGTQFLINGYGLIEEKQGNYKLTEKGKLFISSKNNDAVRYIDTQEGLEFILLHLSAIGKSKRSDFIDAWERYLKNNSNVKKESVVKDYLRVRLSNLTNRNYLKREGHYYTITKEVEKYLNIFLQNIDEYWKNPTLVKESELNSKVNYFVKEQREILRSFLEKTKPYQFEHIVKHLLDAMGYEDVEVTTPTNDKGVDVTGISQNGITTVKEVIQVKRNTKSNVSRTVLDKLRGSLHRFDAFQGTIITLSDFAKGAKESAFEKGAAPITLINGEKLIDLLIEHKIGIVPKEIHYYTVDNNYFDDDNEENID